MKLSDLPGPRRVKGAIRGVVVGSHAFELWMYSRAWRRTRSEGRERGIKTCFVVYGQGRSGSSLLVDLLRSHADIHCDGELFSPRASGRLLSPERYLAARAALSVRPVYGCRIKIYQITQQPRAGDPGLLLSSLHQAGWKFVHLVRRNLFRKSLSLVVTRYREGKFIDRVGDGGQTLGRIKIDPQQVVSVMRKRGEFDRLEIEALGSIPHIEVIYEDDLFDAERHQQTCDRVFDFLGLSSVPVNTQLRRTSKDRVSDYIVNYAELAEAVREAGFECGDERA